MRTLQDIKNDPRSTGRGIREAVQCLEDDVPLDSQVFEDRIRAAYQKGRHASPSAIRYEIRHLRVFFRRELGL